MKVDRDTVKAMADLAKLRLEASDVADYAQSMSEILDLVEEMRAVDTDGVTPLAHPLDARQRLREDKATETSDRERLQVLAPEVSDGLYLVPRVVE
ncbi:MAG TPA: Asp-tRNA(Asn)/Glu-tRNA(Gln) amidotransferase subunit GatC [Pseudomonadales bacterium]|nr:Asp-tRNA(Asn)/Glu-tRNA(Gln) amidotransferase subunit GatC [Pseudomonadales bacterium]